MRPEKLTRALRKSKDLRALPEKLEREIIERAIQNKSRGVGKDNKHE
jgi:hypothetical protein